jgi:hypothetical protein
MSYMNEIHVGMVHEQVPQTAHSTGLSAVAQGIRVYQYRPISVPRWRYEAFQRWFNPSDDERDGVNVFAGRPLRAPGS